MRSALRESLRREADALRANLVRALWDAAPRGTPRRKWLAFARARGRRLTIRDVVGWALRFGLRLNLCAKYPPGYEHRYEAGLM